MKPIEFVTHVEQHNDPIGPIMEAITEKPVVIRGASCEYQILSYYYDHAALCMVLDIEEKS